MKNFFKLFGLASCAVILSSCDALTGIDNYDEPNATISGRVLFEGNPVQLRTRDVELELWEPGFELNEKIPVYVAQDGTFSATVFDGEYRLNTIPNNGPWMNSSDTLNISVRGEAVVDITVQPYFVVRDPQITYDPSTGGAGGTVRAGLRVEMVNPGRQLEWVGLYVATTSFVDRTNRLVQVERSRAQLPADWQTAPISLSVALPADVRLTPSPDPRDHVFVRVGIKSSGLSEMIFSPLVKLPI